MERRLMLSAFLFSISFAMNARAMQAPDMAMPEQRTMPKGACGEADPSSAYSSAEECETEFVAAQADCLTTKSGGVQADYTCDISSGQMNKPPLEIAECKLRQADEYDQAAQRCIEKARAAKAVCNKKQDCVVETDNKLTAKKIEEGAIKGAVAASVPATTSQAPNSQAAPPAGEANANPSGVSRPDKPEVKAQGMNSPQHVATKSTPVTGLKSLPELVSANNSIHDSWHKADALESGPAQEMKQHAQQLRAEAASLRQQAANDTGAASAPPAAKAGTPAPAANQNPQAANPQQSQQQAPPAAPVNNPAAAPQAAANVPSSAFDQGLSTPVNNADLVPSSVLLPGEGVSSAVQSDSSAMSSSGSVSTFDPGLQMPALDSAKGTAVAASASSSGNSSAQGGFSASAGGGDPKGVAPFVAGRAPASSGGAGGGGGGRYSFGGSSGDKPLRGIAGASVGDAAKGAATSQVDLNQFLPSGVARSAAMAAMGIHGAHVNFFNKVNERYHSLEGSLEP